VTTLSASLTSSRGLSSATKSRRGTASPSGKKRSLRRTLRRDLAGEGQVHRHVAPGVGAEARAVGVLQAAEAILVIGGQGGEDRAEGTVGRAGDEVATGEAHAIIGFGPVIRADVARRTIALRCTAAAGSATPSGGGPPDSRPAAPGPGQRGCRATRRAPATPGSGRAGPVPAPGRRGLLSSGLRACEQNQYPASTLPPASAARAPS